MSPAIEALIFDLDGALAKAAGMTVVLVPNHSIPPAFGAREAADIVIHSLAGLDPASTAAGSLT